MNTFTRLHLWLLPPKKNGRVSHELEHDFRKPSSVSEKAMAPHSSTLAWKIPWTEEPGRLQSMRSLRVGHDWTTSLSLFTLMCWRRKWEPTPVFLLGESQGRRALWAAVYGVAQSWTRLKWVSSSSNSVFSDGAFQTKEKQNSNKHIK